MGYTSVRTGLALRPSIPYDLPDSANAPRQMNKKPALSRFGSGDGQEGRGPVVEDAQQAGDGPGADPDGERHRQVFRVSGV